jgi:hypothetical protein
MFSRCLISAAFLSALSFGAKTFAQTARSTNAAAKPAPPVSASGLLHTHYRDELDGPAYIDRMTAAATAVNSFNFLGESTILSPLPSGAFTGLLRQADCSVSLLASVGGSAPVLQSSTPKYGDVLHTLAGLTTTPDVFPNGCVDYGHNGEFYTLVGKTSTGAYIGAEGQLNGTETSISTYVYDLTEMKLLSSAVYPIGPNGGDITVADVNGDGQNDILVLNYSGANGAGAGTVAVLLGNADGTFAPAVQYTLGTNPYAIVVADVNGDSKLDIVAPVSTSASGGEQINVLLGNGDGAFAATPISTPFTGNGGSLDFGDINGDGKADLVLSSGAVLLGKGDGTFTQGTTLAVSGFNVALADVNHDGKLDVAVTVPISNEVSIFLGKGDGTFTAGPNYATVFGTLRLGAADLDGDGNVDLFLGSTGNGAYFPDENQGAYSQAIMSNGTGTAQGAPILSGFGNKGTQTRGIATGDFNGDGKLDLLGAESANNGIAVYIGDGKGDLTAGTVSPAPTSGPIIGVDFNGDTKLDAIGADLTTSAIYTAVGNGDGTFQTVVEYPTPQFPVDIQAMDLNGDGKPDIVALGYNTPYDTSPGSGMYYFKNNGDGTFATAVNLDTTLTSPTNLAIADVNGDGKADLIVAEAGNTFASPPAPGDVRLYLGNGDGTFQAPTVVLPSVFTAGLVVSDVNGDGKLDISTQTYSSDLSSGNIVVLLGNGDGTFQAAKSTTIPDPFGLTNLAVAELHGDGKPDIVSTACCGATNGYIFAGNGDGTFQTGVLLHLAVSPAYVVTADLSGTGIPDLVFGVNGGTIPTAILLLNSPVSVVGSTTTALTVSPNPAVVGQNVTLSAEVTGTGSAAPTGNVNFLDGTTQLGSDALSAGMATYSTSSLAAGAHSLTAQYVGDANNAASVSSAVSLSVTTVPLIPTTTTLTLSATSIVVGSSVTLSAAVAPQTGTVIPTGTVTFLDRTTEIGTGTLGPTGTATYSTSALAVGSHSLTASYGGDTTNAASVSTASTLTVTAASAPDFSLTLQGPTLTVSPTGTATTSVTVTPSGGFSQTVTLTCSGLPTGASCTFAPATVTPTTAAVSSVLTVTTGIKSASAMTKTGSTVAFASVFGLFGLGLMGRSSRFRAFGFMFLLAAAIGGLGGCGGSSKSTTPSGTTTVTVTATAGTDVQTATLSLTVE